jgi:hypothetical protein
VLFVVNGERGGQTLWIGADTAQIRAIWISGLVFEVGCALLGFAARWTRPRRS